MTDFEPLREALARLEKDDVRSFYRALIACEGIPEETADNLFWAIDASRENPSEHPLCVMATQAALLGYRSRQGEVDRLVAERDELREMLRALAQVSEAEPESSYAFALLAKGTA